MINDVSALTYDARSAEVAASLKVPVVLMHHKGAPEVMQDDPRYDDVLVEVYLWLEERIAAAVEAGVARESILIDPGFGLRQECRAQSRADERARAIPFARLPVGGGSEPQANHRRALERSAGRSPDRRKHRFRDESGRSRRADHPRPRRFRNRAGAKIWRGMRDQALTPRL